MAYDSLRSSELSVRNHPHYPLFNSRSRPTRFSTTPAAAGSPLLGSIESTVTTRAPGRRPLFNSSDSHISMLAIAATLTPAFVAPTGVVARVEGRTAGVDCLLGRRQVATVALVSNVGSALPPV